MLVCLLDCIFKQNGSSSAMFFLSRIFMEQGTKLPKALDKLFLPNFILIGSVFLAMILTNPYRGMLNSDLSAPLPRYHIQTVNEAVNLGLKILTHIPRTVRHFRYALFRQHMFKTNTRTAKLRLIGILGIIITFWLI
jgi:hypothetical protein